jgi:hypothetical protein
MTATDKDDKTLTTLPYFSEGELKFQVHTEQGLSDETGE